MQAKRVGWGLPKEWGELPITPMLNSWVRFALVFLLVTLQNRRSHWDPI